MKQSNAEETRSYRDPIATRMTAARRRKEALEAEYPSVRVTYDGFYFRQTEFSEEGSRYILGAEGIIGSELHCAVRAKADDALQLEAAVVLLAAGGRELAQIKGSVAERLAAHLANGWHIKALLCTTFFRAQDKRGMADIACICWKPSGKTDAALENFARNIAERQTKGDRAGVTLTQEQYIHVIKSGGEWFLTPATKREPLEKGTVVYKSQRSGTERLTGFALNHRSGCNILASLFWVLLVAGAAALVWFFFFR